MMSPVAAAKWRIAYDRWAPLLAFIIFLVALGAGVGTYFNDRANARQDREQLADNTANAVISCENANESREASRTLWNYVVTLSVASNPDAGPEQLDYYDEVRAWINKVYQPRDCDDLSRKYEIPPPPSLPQS